MARRGARPQHGVVSNERRRGIAMPRAPQVFRKLAVTGVAALVGIVVWGGLSPAAAVPVFARKYQTSCQTCHVAFPKLNPFGEAFRLRGYRMPAETEDMIKEKPIPL